MLDRERILDLWAAGETSAVIANTLGIPDSTTVRCLVARERARGDARAAIRQSGVAKRYDRDTILDLWADGNSAGQIAGKIGSSASLVHNILSEIRATGDERAAYHQHSNRDDWWSVEAGKRGTTRAALRRKILRVVERDELLTAILDDAGGA